MSHSVLTARQLRFLELAGQNSDIVRTFYLSGGTALAGFYLEHRYSEDLDFFSEQEFDSLAIASLLEQLKPALGFTNVDYQHSFNRHLFFLHFDNEVLKTEFTYYPFPRLEKGKTEYNLSIDSLRDIAVNKLITIHQQSRARDYIDLYSIIRTTSWQITDLIKDARLKFDWHIDPLQLGTQFMLATEAKDLPRLLKPLDSKEWHDFFVEEARKLKPAILSK